MGYSNSKNAIEERDLSLDDQPYFVVFIPPVAIAPNATAIVTQNMSVRDFIWDTIGWTTDAVFTPSFWMPAVGVPFRITIQDINRQRFFSNERLDMMTVTGTNPQWNDKGMYRLSRPWRFYLNTTISVEFLNDGPVAATPRLTLGGFLTNPIR